jgi:hypothetical protein
LTVPFKAAASARTLPAASVVTTGTLALTVTVDVASEPATVLLMVLSLLPVEEAVTVSVAVRVEFAGSELIVHVAPPLALTQVSGEVAEQDTKVTPEGKVSVTTTFERAVPVAGLLAVKV